MTDITELAQREKFEAWARSQQLSIAYGDCGYVYSSTEMAWRAVKALSAELVEALEKAQAENTAGVAGMAESYETTISMLRSRIAELESRTVKLPVGYTASSGHPFNEAKRTVMIPGGGDWLNRLDVEHVLTAAGIKVEAE
ncbi:hypothetical protein VZC42_17310 [Raoultella ornithinolytica]|uniref:hypothetical protein n=1 Tax=Raoultella ornithinolytica TaxID=54291 RepID=UPI0038A6CBBA